MTTHEVRNLPAGALLQRAGGQDRSAFNTAALEELAASIAENGLAQPPTVRPVGDRFEIVAGERRIRAMRDILGWETIPCIVRELTDETAARIMLVENVNRVDLDPLDEARAYQERAERFGWTPADVARTCGIPAQRVRDRLRLLDLTDEVAHYVTTKALPLTYAGAMTVLDSNRQHLALTAYQEHHPALPAFRALCTRLLDEQEAEAAEAMFDPESFLKVEEYVRTAEELVRLEEPEPVVIREEIVGPGEIAARLRVKAQTVAIWRQRGIFPAPDLRVSGRDLWYVGTVDTWAHDTGRVPGEQLGMLT